MIIEFAVTDHSSWKVGVRPSKNIVVPVCQRYSPRRVVLRLRQVTTSVIDGNPSVTIRYVTSHLRQLGLLLPTGWEMSRHILDKGQWQWCLVGKVIGLALSTLCSQRHKGPFTPALATKSQRATKSSAPACDFVLCDFVACYKVARSWCGQALKGSFTVHTIWQLAASQ